MFNMTPFLPARILPTNTTTYDLENQAQGHYPIMTFENYGMNHSWFIINIGVQELAYLQFYMTLTLPTVVYF